VRERILDARALDDLAIVVLNHELLWHPEVRVLPHQAGGFVSQEQVHAGITDESHH
jgi:hypothetical protein